MSDDPTEKLNYLPPPATSASPLSEFIWKWVEHNTYLATDGSLFEDRGRLNKSGEASRLEDARQGPRDAGNNEPAPCEPWDEEDELEEEHEPGEDYGNEHV